jgi:hypothetical protein
MKNVINSLSQLLDDDNFDDDNDFEEDEQNQEKEITKKIERVANILIPSDKEELLHLLSELSVQLKANRWYKKSTRDGKIKNKFSDALFEKYKQCVYKLEAISPESQVEYYKNILKKQACKRFFEINSGLIKSIILIILCLVAIVFLFQYILYFVLIAASILVGYIIITKIKKK